MKSVSSLNHRTAQNVELIAKIEKASQDHRSTGEKVADSVTGWIGSWTFLIGQSVLLMIWIILNLVGWWRHWDPYPFILLNLALSFQAAYATPIIMISQNRQALIDARRNRLDLQINLLAEQENTEQLLLLRLLCKKLDVRMTGPESGLEQPTKPDEIIRQIEKATQPAKTSTSPRNVPKRKRRKA